MQKEIYSFTLKTPHGSVKGEADSLCSLASLLPIKMSVVEIDLNATVQEILDAYKARCKAGNYPRSRIAMVGLEPDLVKCYLRGLTIEQTIKWFKAKRGFTASKSAIGRYWTAFCDMGIASLRKMPALKY